MQKAIIQLEKKNKKQKQAEQRWQLRNGQNIIGTCPTSDRQMQSTMTQK